MKKFTNAKTLTTAGVIAALYAALTYAAAVLNLAYGPFQFRFSEALTVLPMFTPAAIPGLTVGCLIANLTSTYSVDLLFGTVATLIAALLTARFKNVKTFGAPLLSLFPPVIINALLIGLEISLFYLGGFTISGFLISFATVGVGQFLVCYGLGLPLYFALNKHKRLFK